MFYTFIFQIPLLVNALYKENNVDYWTTVTFVSLFVCLHQAGLAGKLECTPGWTGRQAGLAGRDNYVLGLSVRPITFFRLFVRLLPNLNTIFWKRINIGWCKLARVIHGARARNSQGLGPGGQRSRSHDVEYRFGGVACQRHHTRTGLYISLSIVILGD